MRPLVTSQTKKLTRGGSQRINRIIRSLALDHREGGKLLIVVPNVESLSAYFFGERWYHQDPPRHLFHFSPRTLRSILEKAGFAQVEISHLPTTSGFSGSLQLIWNEAAGNPKGKRLRWSKGLNLSLWPISFPLAKLGRGEILRALAFKRSRV